MKSKETSDKSESKTSTAVDNNTAPPPMYETKREDSVPAGSSPRRYAGAWARWRRALPIEATIWTAGLLAVATMDPHGEHLIRLCPLDALGLSFCPGCGLGHSVAHLARGDLAASVQAHPLGVPAVLILGAHVGRLLRLSPPSRTSA